jgi:glycosyltransferase involved in cell wall biosynthesis
MQDPAVIYFSVTNDLTGDQRVHRIITTLVNSGRSVTLVGRKLPDSLPLAGRAYKTYRLRLLFRKGFLFYACFNFRLFLFLVTRRSPEIFVANDLDTLPANFMASGIRRKPLVYDSHEYFTEVPELIGRGRVKRFWLAIETFIVPRLKYAYTVSEPIADAYREKYGVSFEVIRNYPLREKKAVNYVLPFDRRGWKMLIYQGAVNLGRGLELLTDAVAGMDNVILVIAGDGDIRQSLEKRIAEKNAKDKIFLTGRIPFEKLHGLTVQADAGVSLEEDMGLNYRFAMPNKLFDYIQAGLPVLVSNLPEMKRVVEQYKIGLVAVSRDTDQVRKMINTLLNDQPARSSWKTGIEKAARELCWEAEEEKLRYIYKRAGNAMPPVS